MAKFAAETEVSVEKTRAEIERTIMRYGATSFIVGWQGTQAVIGFEMRSRRLRFHLPLPDRNDKSFKFTPQKKLARTPEQVYEAWEQACRQRWRALLLAVKAKLEAVECGIASFEDEFMAYIELPNGRTIGETIVPQIEQAYATGKMPPLLPGPVQ